MARRHHEDHIAGDEDEEDDDEHLLGTLLIAAARRRRRQRLLGLALLRKHREADGIEDDDEAEHELAPLLFAATARRRRRHRLLGLALMRKRRGEEDIGADEDERELAAVGARRDEHGAGVAASPAPRFCTDVAKPRPAKRVERGALRRRLLCVPLATVAAPGASLSPRSPGKPKRAHLPKIAQGTISGP